AAYALYTREHRKRQQLQYLYQSSDLLQRVATQNAAIPELLRQLCQVFRADAARITLLPMARTGVDGHTFEVRHGETMERPEAVNSAFLESFAPLLQDDQRGFIAVPPRISPESREWLAYQSMRNAMCTALQTEGQLLGSLIIGNRLSDVGGFDDDDLTLLETFAAQASVAVQNSRLGDRLEHQAFHDPLTGLANRALFIDRLQHALKRRDDHRDTMAVIFLDLDDFKMVNDTLGHAAGDELLCEVSNRLKTVLRPSDTAARFGGDEFALLLEEAAEPYAVIGIAERIAAALKPHFRIAGREVAVHASVGVAYTSAHDVEAEELLRHADVAMYRAKKNGKGGFEVFEPGMQEVVNRRLEVKTDLEHALAAGELVLHYQPVVDLATGRATGVEALVRWNHPRWGRVMPNEFISIAEETGLIDDLGVFVLREACRQCQRWQTAFPDHDGFSVSVNVSPRQLRDEHFVADVWRVLSQTGLHPSRLVLEITESYMVDDPQHATERLHELKKLGVRLSIDDFGTGYSSLAVLQELPIDILKIDKAFVDHVVDDPRRAAFAQAIVRMGKTLGLGLIAEGVESGEQAERLRALGCGLAQGYHFSQPVEPSMITRMLHRDASATVEAMDLSVDSVPETIVLPLHRASDAARAERRMYS
ncbi:MAG: EAL domain-containing protein, partial [Candidatus Dormibacteraeota bacterium]|nr:EAL domain-containing protein [Candidatus Dormibacteraeota bacterium]